jgi:hypothetical protein
MAVVQAPLGGTAQTDDEDQPATAPSGGLGALAAGQFSGLSGPYQALYQQMQQNAQQKQQAQQEYLASMQKQEGALSQTGMSDLDRASLMFQAAGALGQTTRSGGFGETLGNLGTAMSGPLSKAAEAQRTRQAQLQQLQLARQKLGVEMAGSGGVDPAQALQLLKAQQDQEEEPELKDITLSNGTKMTVKWDGKNITDLQGNPMDISKVAAASAAGVQTGDEYLKTIDPDLAMETKALAAGQKPPNLGSMGAARSAALLGSLRQYLGNDQEGYNNVVSGRRAQVAADMLSSKPNTMGFAIKSAGKLAGHMDEYAQAANNMGNSGYYPVDAARWAIASVTPGADSGKLTAFKTAQNVAAEEAARAAKGGVPAVSEMHANLALGNHTQSPDSFQSYFDTQHKIIKDAVMPFMDQYNKVMGTNYTDPAAFVKVFAPGNGQHIDNLENLTVKGSAKWQQQQQQQQQQQKQPSAPDAQGWTTLPNGIRIRQKQDQ